MGAIAEVLCNSRLTLAAGSATIALLSYLIYRAFFSPLARIPGPIICRFTNVWMWYHTYVGDDCTLIRDLHKLYGPVVRIGPNDCVLSDGAALAPIYSEHGGFLKSDCYANFDLEGHKTIFSATDPAHRAIRSKAVTGLFSTSSIRAKHDLFEDCAKRFVARIKEEATSKTTVDMSTLCRRAALDLVCSYLFQTPYGGIEEDNNELSAAIFVDSAVAFGRFFFLPHWLFEIIELVRSKYFSSQRENAGIATVDDYGHTLSSIDKPGTYQSRLRQAGISEHEVEIQCKDVMFAGTDSSGTVLAATCWHLAKNPDVYQQLREEVSQADSAGEYGLQSLKYLDSVVREGLRLARANPTRFPRIVPSGGWTFSSSTGKEYYFPSGTCVGLAPMTLHFNPDVFRDPEAFDPSRWDNASVEMQRDLIPFNIGARQCIARNMAQYELLVCVRELARSNVLAKARAVGNEIKIVEWFNSKTIAKVELAW